MIDLSPECAALDAWADGLRRAGTMRALGRPAGGPWPRRTELVLGADVGLDLGHPGAGSVEVTLWRTADRPAQSPTPVWRVGQDLGTLAQTHGGPERPLGLVIRATYATPAPDDRQEYARYLDLRQCLYGLELSGVSMRSRPSAHRVWLRLHRDALADGLGLAHIGWALADALAALPGVAAAEVIWVTAGRAALAPLTEIAAAAWRKAAALIKRNEEAEAECDACDYADVCGERDHSAGGRPAPPEPEAHAEDL